MGWRCLSCGNTKEFFEKNVMETKVYQEPLSTRIERITNRYLEEPVLDVWCSRCDSSDVRWTDLIGQDNDYLFEAIPISTASSVSVIVFELNTITDIIPKHEGAKEELDFELFDRLMKENSSLLRPIRNLEFIWDRGNPLLHPRIKDFLDIINKGRYNLTMATNARNLIRNLEGLELPKNTQLILMLDSPDEKKNDSLMGDGTFSSTIKAFSYLEEKKIPFSVFMRVNRNNYMDVKEMKRMLKSLRVLTLTAIEETPTGTNTDSLLTDEMKTRLKKDMADPILPGNIHLAECLPKMKCSYQDKSRIFIDSGGYLSFCHFTSGMIRNRIADANKLSLLEILSQNSSYRSRFIKEKEIEFKCWSPPRKTSSPCSYCIRHLGLDERW